LEVDILFAIKFVIHRNLFSQSQNFLLQYQNLLLESLIKALIALRILFISLFLSSLISAISLLTKFLLCFGWVVGWVGVWRVWVGPGLVWMGCVVFAAVLLWGGRLLPVGHQSSSTVSRCW
jgi:hypothetical protein